MLLYRVCFKAGRLPALMEQNLKYQALAVLATRVHQNPCRHPELSASINNYVQHVTSECLNHSYLEYGGCMTSR